MIYGSNEIFLPWSHLSDAQMKTTFLDSGCKLKYFSLFAARRRGVDVERGGETILETERRSGALVGNGRGSKVMRRRWWKEERWKDGGGGVLTEH